MQLVWRPLAERETDHELIWLSVSLVSLGLAAVWFALHLPWPVCPFQSLTGNPCGWSIFSAYALAVLATRAPRLRIRRITAGEKKFWRVFFASLFVLNWIYLLAHRADF